MTSSAKAGALRVAARAIIVKSRTAQIVSDTQIIERQARELRTLDELKSRFFANISHELRTPLTLILAPLKQVLQRKTLQQQDQEHLTTVQRSALRLLRLVNEILDLTKLEAGKMRAYPTTVDYLPFLQKIMGSFEAHAKQANVKLTFLYDLDESLQLEFDPQKTEIILTNLLSNAIKFTPPGGGVTFLAESRKGYLKLLVQDTGRGIHAEDVPHIFDRYFQSKQQNMAAEGGTGIGLALAQEFAKMQDGTLIVCSEQGKGTTFTLYLPFRKSSATTAPETQEDSPLADRVIYPFPSSLTSTNGIKANVLLVEDNPDLRAFVHHLLEPHYQLQTAENGQQALEKLARQLPDLLISDIMMPVMDGYQLLETLKSNPKYRYLPVIMLTARAGQDDRLKALRIGVDDYILKPFDNEELLVRIHNLLHNNQERLKALRQQESAQTDDAPIPEEDNGWLNVLEQKVLDNIHRYEFSVNDLADALATNRWTLNERLKTLTGLTTQQYIQEVRLTRARFLLESRTTKSVKVTAYEIGMKDVKYFSRLFKQRFGKTPSSLL